MTVTPLAPSTDYVVSLEPRALFYRDEEGSDHMNMIDRVRSYKYSEVEFLKRERPEAALRDVVAAADPPRGFRARLNEVSAATGLALIAEVKKSSPSAGQIREPFDPAAIAHAYEAGGAACLSVLVDYHSFEGTLDHLIAARSSCSLPVLAKDFYLDTYQVLRARVSGADCIIIILALVEDAVARQLERVAFDLGMDALIEVHDADELARALTMESRLVGINNRNLVTLETSLETAETLSSNVPDDYTVMGESGLSRRSDLERLLQTNVHSFLVGESLLRSSDVRLATEQLLAPEPAGAESGTLHESCD